MGSTTTSYYNRIRAGWERHNVSRDSNNTIRSVDTVQGRALADLMPRSGRPIMRSVGSYSATEQAEIQAAHQRLYESVNGKR
ncbi:MAG: hypothetical protein R3C68_12035 [Myxococcota bacterium]